MPEREARQTHGVKLTYDDLLLLPEDGMRHELIDGEHYVTPSPNLSHQSIVVNLTAVLATYLEEHPIGDVYPAPTDVVFDPTNVVEPDVLYFSHGRGNTIFREKRLTGAPELVVEVALPSTRTRDRGEPAAILRTDLLPDLQLPLTRIFKRRSPRNYSSSD